MKALVRRGREALFPSVVWHADGARNAVALTFDDGPSLTTAAILDVLAAQGAQATFFVLGDRLRGRESLVLRAVAEGHEIGSHLVSHRNVRTLSPWQIAREVVTARTRIRDACGTTPRFVRPPYGAAPTRLQRLAGPLGHTATVMWSLNPRDWEAGADEIAACVDTNLEPGAIVLLHDGLAPGRERSQDATLAALPAILATLCRRSLRPVTLTELLRDAP